MDDRLNGATAYRTGAAGGLRDANAGEDHTLVGWVHRRRDLGGLVFVDLRDREGLLQVSFDPAWSPPEALREARALGPEDVIRVEGRLEDRGANRNPEMASGGVELRATRLEVIARADPLPIPVYRTPEEELPAEELRLRHRFLDLRRPELQRNFVLRHRAAQSVRNFLSAQGFLEVETPMLTRRTPEGARDYLVPSRVHAGEFYALPQSPQLYKQLLMVAGFERYFQIARCLRDEDLRADRQPEFTQVDGEMSFVDEEDVFRVCEGMIGALWRDVLGVELEPFRRLTHREALLRYGSDKPDLRYGLEIEDLTELLQEADFRVFQGTVGTPQRIRGIVVPGGSELSRRELDALQDVAREAGAPGVLWVKRGSEGYSGTFAKALEGTLGTRLAVKAGMGEGALLVLVVGTPRVGEGPSLAPEGIEGALDALRRHLAARLGLLDGERHAWAWVTEFPFFEQDAESGRMIAAHHPFTMPHADDVELLRQGVESGEAATLLAVRARSYDAVYNGNELASGSVRIHQAELQRLVFRALGIGAEEAREKFGFLLEAFRYGAPPHAGFAFGFDRLAMLMAGAPSLRDVIAFPKTTAARALFEGAPSAVPPADLKELHVNVIDTAAAPE
jgi:aspartyl-tRNA synthetase